MPYNFPIGLVKEYHKPFIVLVKILFYLVKIMHQHLNDREWMKQIICLLIFVMYIEFITVCI